MMIGQMPALPGLADIPVSYGTSGVPLNVPYPRPVATGYGLSKFFNPRPPWPSTPYGYQHKPLGGPITAFVAGSAIGIVGGYFMTVAQLYIFARVFDVDVSAKKLWLGAAVYYGLQLAAMFAAGVVAYANAPMITNQNQ